MDALTVFLEHVVLFTAPEVGHISRDERKLASEKFCRLSQAVGRHSEFVRGIVLGLLRQHFFQQRLEFMELGFQQIARASARIDEAPQNWGILE